MIRFQGIVYRILPCDADPTLPVANPEGRFHHGGQSALYTSLTPEGTAVAIRRYVRPGDPPRVVVPLTVQVDRVADLRGEVAASVIWQDLRALGQPAPTWALSDRARAAGAGALLYASRSRRDLTHCVLFAPPATVIVHVGAAIDAAPYLFGLN